MKKAKPEAVIEVEASAPTAVDQAWAKLRASQESLTEDDLALIVPASREQRARWLLKQKTKGKDE